MGYAALVELAVRYITDVACFIQAGSCWKLLLRFPGFAEPRPPPLADPKNGGAAVVLPLGAVWVTQDHREDPEKCGCPCEEEDHDAE